MLQPGARPEEAAANGWLSALAKHGGFRSDARFDDAPEVVEEEPEIPELDEAPEEAAGADEAASPDPVAMAFTEGFSAGVDQARAEAHSKAEEDAVAREALTLSFERIDRQLEEELRMRLRETVAALCEQAIAPLALDMNMLVCRVEKAASMLARADDERVIRLHPEDLELVSTRLAKHWTIEPDPTLDRGAIRVEGTNGGIEDGPATWRRAIAEALHKV
ncbi:hypothetical protein B2G71_01490 [Novosphingobium sp. PC22D]|nr:hypothetical protein B2G71_01490 [Novosphingobium sp. PC22D]